MAGFPIGFPLLGALAGAAWVLADDGSDTAAKKGAGLGFLVGLGLGALKATAESSTASSPQPAGIGGAARRQPGT